MDDNQEKLKKYILDLALNSPKIEIEEKIEDLRAIYVDDFRHYYSGIFGISNNPTVSHDKE